MNRTRVWIDTDPSIGLWFHDADDAFALSLAAASPELEIAGISVSYGNTSQRRAMRIAQQWAAAAGVDPGLLHAGAVRRGVGAAEAERCAFLRAIKETEQPLDYIALGPLTHLADALEHEPALARKIGRVVFVGGRTPGCSLRMGNRIPYEFHDANFEKDPAAAARVLESGIQIDLLPVEMGTLCMLRPANFQELERGGAAGRWLAARGGHWLRNWRWGFGLEGAPCFDLPAVGALLRPDLFQWETRGLSIRKLDRAFELAAVRGGEGVMARFCVGLDPDFIPFSVRRISAWA